MKLITSIFICLCLAATTVRVSAAVIYSSCPVRATSSDRLIDRFRPSESRLRIRSYVREVPLIARYVQWLFTGRRPAPSSDADASFKAAGQWLEDLQLAKELSSSAVDCHAGQGVPTEPYAIFPFVMKVKDEAGQMAPRVRYKLCEYYVDQQRQLPFENECTILGRETGYTFAELQKRFNILKQNVESTRENLRVSTYFAGLVASLTSFKFVRLLKAGPFVSLSVALLPGAGAYYAVQQGWTDELVRDFMDLNDAAEIAMVGDLSTSVAVARPIQDFVPYFQRYLESL